MASIGGPSDVGKKFTQYPVGDTGHAKNAEQVEKAKPAVVQKKEGLPKEYKDGKLQHETAIKFNAEAKQQQGMGQLAFLGINAQGIDGVQGVDAITAEQQLAQTSALFSAGGNMAAVLNGYSDLALDGAPPAAQKAVLAQASAAVSTAEQGAMRLGLDSADKALQAVGPDQQDTAKGLINRWQVLSGQLKQAVEQGDVAGGAEAFAELRDINQQFNQLSNQELATRLAKAEDKGVDVKADVAKQSLDMATDFRNMLGGYELALNNPTTNKKALTKDFWQEIDRVTERFGALGQTKAFDELYGNESAALQKEFGKFRDRVGDMELDQPVLNVVKGFNEMFLDIVKDKAEGGICKTEAQILNAGIENATETRNIMDGYLPAIMGTPPGPARDALIQQFSQAIDNNRNEALTLGIIKQTPDGIRPTDLAKSAFGDDAKNVSDTHRFWRPLRAALKSGEFKPELLAQIRESNDRNIQLLSARLAKIDED